MLITSQQADPRERRTDNQQDIETENLQEQDLEPVSADQDLEEEDSHFEEEEELYDEA